MSFTYAPGVLSGRDYVRLLIGDTDCDCPLLEDHEIASMLGLYPNEVRAAAHLASALSAEFAAKGVLSVGRVKIDNISKAEFFKSLSDRLFLQVDGSTMGALPIAAPSVGGQSVASKESAALDTATVQPAFRRNQFTHQEATED